MNLSRFWLLNGSKKKGKKSVKKVSKRIAKKVSINKPVSKKKFVARPKEEIKKVVKEVVYVPQVRTLPTSLMTMEEKNKYRGNKSMAKRVKRSVVKATKKVKKIKRSLPMLAKDHKLGSKHRVTAFYKGGALRTSTKSKIAKKNLKINPFKVKGIVNELKPAVVIGSTSVATAYGLQKVMPKIPYVKAITNTYAKAGIKVALGLIASMGLRKVYKTKNNNISNGILIGSIISALMDFVKISNTQETVQGIKLNGIKVLGNALSFGRPKTALANPNFQMNGIKIDGKQNLQAIKFNKNYNANNTVSGCSERY